MPRMTETPAAGPWARWAKAAIEAPMSGNEAMAPLAPGPSVPAAEVNPMTSAVVTADAKRDVQAAEGLGARRFPARHELEDERQSDDSAEKQHEARRSGCDQCAGQDGVADRAGGESGGDPARGEHRVAKAEHRLRSDAGERPVRRFRREMRPLLDGEKDRHRG